MYRVLVFGMTDNPGGVESFLLNYYRRIDKTKIQFDFLCNSYKEIAYEKELIELGARIFRIAPRSEHYGLYHRELNEVFKKFAGEFDAIWVNVCSLANIDYLKIAAKYGIERRIIHSHNSQNMDSALRGMLHKWNRRKIRYYATDFWSCSEDAARWFYDKKLMEKNLVIHNAVDINRLTFDEEKRMDVRRKIKCENRFIIGNVGRLHFQKNQSFMLDILKNLITSAPEVIMIFVGQGEDEEKLKSKVNELGLNQYVLFAGVQKNIGEWLSAFDLFLFPSVFEGLGIAALEAQANGIPVLASARVIPEDVRINDNFEFYSLSLGADNWAKKILEMKDASRRIEKDRLVENFNVHGYNIDTEAPKLEKLFGVK